MSDAYERLNDEAEKRTWELSAREYEGLYERYKPGRDCDPAPIEEVTFEEQMEWEEIKKRQEGLRAMADHHEPIRSDYAQRERLFQRFRETLMTHGIPFPRANFLAEKLLIAFTESA